MRIKSAFLFACFLLASFFGKHRFLKQLFIISVRSSVVISFLLYFDLDSLWTWKFVGPSVFMYSFISFSSTAPTVVGLSLIIVSSSFRNKPFMISSAVSCQLLVIDPFAFLTVNIKLPVFNLSTTIGYMMDHDSLFMLSSTYLFHAFPLAGYIAALYFLRSIW